MVKELESQLNWNWNRPTSNLTIDDEIEWTIFQDCQGSAGQGLAEQQQPGEQQPGIGDCWAEVVGQDQVGTLYTRITQPNTEEVGYSDTLRNGQKVSL